jgi:lysophospholipase L1-like esterase
VNPDHAGLPWKRFAALGDSLTDGVGDPDPRGSLRGWADRLADVLAEVEPELQYTNLARRGLRAEEVRQQQLEAALRFRPDLASVLVGMNDLLEPGFDLAAYERELEEIVGALGDAGALVLTATFPDVTLFSPLPARFTAGLRARLRAASEAVRHVSARHKALMLEAENLPEARQRDVISVDRLHPGPRGHILVATSFARLLEQRAGVPIPQPDDGDIAGKLAQARWLLQQFRPADVARFVYRFYVAPRRLPGRD